MVKAVTIMSFSIIFDAKDTYFTPFMSIKPLVINEFHNSNS